MTLNVIKISDGCKWYLMSCMRRKKKGLVAHDNLSTFNFQWVSMLIRFVRFCVCLFLCVPAASEIYTYTTIICWYRHTRATRFMHPHAYTRTLNARNQVSTAIFFPNVTGNVFIYDDSLLDFGHTGSCGYCGTIRQPDRSEILVCIWHYRLCGIVE